MVKSKAALWQTAFGFLLMVGLVTNVGLPGSRPIVFASIATPIMATGGCDLDCSDSGCESGWHDAWNTTPPFYRWTRNGGAHLDGLCREFTCDERHGPECIVGAPAPSRVDLEALRRAIAVGDVSSIALQVAKHPKRLNLNVGRGAVQLLSCRGDVVMHLPLAPDVANAVDKAVALSPESN